MNRLAISFLAAILSIGYIPDIHAQGRPGGTNGRPTSSRTGTQSRPGSSSSRTPQTTRPQQSSTSRPASRPSSTGNVTRPQGSSAQPAVRPGTSNTSRPSSSRPGATTQTGNTRPGNVRPGGNIPGNVRPGTSKPGIGTRPGSSRPDNMRPGTGRPGNSMPRPGGWNPVTPPHHNWTRPGYRPPRPNGGYWGPPAPYPYRIGFWVPPVPPRYTYAYVGAPSLGTILGLTFGSFIDMGINSLYNAGYNVAGYSDNVIYLTNVTQLGMLWPEVAMNYTNGLLTNSQFCYYSAVPGQGRFNTAYTHLCSIYGAPVANTGNTVTWWAGDNTGYITLHYSYSNSLSGLPGYYTTLTYSAYY